MNQPLSQLPRPKGSLLLGNTKMFAHNPLAFLSECGQQYQDLVPLRFALTPACLLLKPEYIEQVLREREIFVKDTPAWRAIRTLVGEGLIASEGDFWARQRRLTQPIFHQQRITAYSAVMVTYAQHMMQPWQDGEIRNIHDDMMRLTLNIVTKSLFNTDMTGKEAQIIAHTLEAAMEWFSLKRKQGFLLLKWLPTPANRRYQATLDVMDAAILELVQQRRQSHDDPGDLLSMLIQAQDADDGSRMTDKQLRDELTTLILAGHETTANALSWTWMLLSQHPSVQDQLMDELRQVLGDRPPTVADLPHLPYAHAIIKEALRLYPPIYSLARSPLHDYDLDGFLIPKGSVVMLSPWVMQRSDRYFDHPHEFRPERWQNDLEKQLPKGVYFPFGEGPRICIGKGFAMMESVLLLATIAQQVQLVLLPDQTLTPSPSITLRPQNGIQVKVVRRR